MTADTGGGLAFGGGRYHTSPLSGGNLSVAVGPIGRNAEATGSINKFATMYSYSRVRCFVGSLHVQRNRSPGLGLIVHSHHCPTRPPNHDHQTRGLFGGASLEGSVIFERSDANAKAYGALDNDTYENSMLNDDDDDDDDRSFDNDRYDIDESRGNYDDPPRNTAYHPSSGRSSSKKGGVTAKMLLSGQVPPPPWANMLISSIERKLGSTIEANWIDDAPRFDHSDEEENRRNRGYSFGSEHAHQSSDNTPVHSPTKDLKTRAKDRLSMSVGGRSKSNDGEWDRTASGLSASTGGNRSRGYSLGSFGGGKGIKSAFSSKRSGDTSPGNPGSQSAHGRERSSTYSQGDPDYRYRYEDDDDNQPPSPSASSSVSSRSARFTEFMRRPVLPTRKSASAVQSFNANSADMRDGGSPLGSGRNRSQSNAKKPKNGGSKSRMEYRGRYDDSTEDDDALGFPHANFGGVTQARASRDGAAAADDDDGGTSSPFADPDRFGAVHSVEHRFDEEAYDDRYDKRASDRQASRYSPTMSKRKSVLSTAAGVFSRPLTKRSATAPTPRRRGTQEQRASYDDDAEEERRDRLRREREEDDYFGDTRGTGASREVVSGIKLYPDEYSDDDEHAANHANPFGDHHEPDEDGRHTSRDASHSRDTYHSRDAFQTRDLLSTLTEDEDANLHGSRHAAVVQPAHRLDRYGLGDHDGDSRSIRSIDSENEFTFGTKAHRLPIKMERNDLSGKPKEMRTATFDFEGGEVSGRGVTTMPG